MTTWLISVSVLAIAELGFIVWLVSRATYSENFTNWLQYHKVAELEYERDEWKNAIIERLVVSHIYHEDHDDDPEMAVNDLLRWETELALDPAVSRAAQALIDKGFEQAQSSNPATPT